MEELNNTAINPIEIKIGKNYIGRCKWFNSKNGYGFISFKNDKDNINDIFIHHNSIKVNNEQYKYLVVGEYVNFKIIENDNINNKYKYYASEVCGIDDGKLMCETRKEIKDARIKFKSINSSSLPTLVSDGVEEQEQEQEQKQEWKISSKKNRNKNTTKNTNKNTSKK
jgi:cold shock CspA family protein